MGHIEDKDRAVKKASKLKEDGNIEEAISQFKLVLSNYGQEPKIVLMVAMLLQFELEDSEAALQYSQLSVQLLPNNEHASINLFHCLFDLEKKEESEKEIRRYVNTGSKLDLYLVLFEENELDVDDFKTV